MRTKYLFLHEHRNKHKILHSNVLNFCLNHSTKVCVIPLKYMDKTFSVISRLIKVLCHL